MASLIDWKLAARTAKALAPAPPNIEPADAEAAVAQLRADVDIAAEHVAELTRLQEPPVRALTRVVDRDGWIDVNTDGMASVMDRVSGKLAKGGDPGRLTQAVGARATGIQAGALIAFLSGKVLGQFEFFARPEGQLLLVAPNIVSVERSLRVNPADFRLWVCLHEVTHRVQFTAVPWMREHLISEIDALTDELDADPDVLRARIFDAVKSLRDRKPASDATDEHGGGLLSLLATPEQRAIVDRLTAFMSLVEGHAEYVMNAVSADVIPSQKTIERRFGARRRKGGNPLDRMVRKLLGLDAKTRQYVEGSAFVRGVVDRIGVDDFNAIWTSRETLPTKAEIAAPGDWVTRVHG
ncbi:MAG: hypothetical protein JWN61_1690 [Pseudonocardiales bacterium]|nr:hypothetical protein [Pseudonocardiales bacterium]